MSISFEQAYAAFGRAVDAYAAENEGSLPRAACRPLFIRAVAADLIREEQKVPPALADITGMIREGVEILNGEDTGLPQRYVAEVRAALAQADKFLYDLTRFRVNMASMPENIWARIASEAQDAEKLKGVWDQLDGAQEAQESGVEPSGERVVVEMPDEVREELEAADRALRELDADPAGDEAYVWNPGPGTPTASPMPGRYIGLPPEPPMMVVLTDGEPSTGPEMPDDVHFHVHVPVPDVPDAQAVDVPAEIPAGLVDLMTRPEVFVEVADTAELEPVGEDPNLYVVLLDGVSTVAKSVVMEEADSYPAEKLMEGDVLPINGGVFYVVKAHRVGYSDGSRIVTVTYTDGDTREWFPGTMVTAWRPE